MHRVSPKCGPLNITLEAINQANQQTAFLYLSKVLRNAAFFSGWQLLRARAVSLTYVSWNVCKA